MKAMIIFLLVIIGIFMYNDEGMKKCQDKYSYAYCVRTI